MTGPAGFHVDADRLATQAGEFAELATRAAAVHRELRDTLAEVGRCWGSDAVGQSFAAMHVDAADTTLDQLGALPKRLRAVGTGFAAAGAAYREQDMAGAGRLAATDDGGA